MARTKKEIKPLVSVQHDYKDSLENAQNEAQALYSAVRTICNMKDIGVPAKVQEILKERCDAYEKAMYGNE